ncbi:MAG: hypothetical protein GY737_11330 [Desulfobacteraceae bacterium]|nr:hypothetical protein [Desulfobacteraceae bacterium]
MVLNISGNNDAAAFVRRPAFEVSFGGGGGAGGLAAAAAAGQGGAASPWARSVVGVNVEVGLAPFVDVVTVALASDGDAPEVALDDPGTVSLGYEDSATDLVFTGMVDRISRSLQGAQRLQGGNGGVLLSRLRINQSYEQQSAGDLVNDLAGQAGVETDTVESGVDLSFYVLDDRSNAYEHMATLARKSGYHTGFTPEGKLYFGPYVEGQAVQNFSYGIDILSLRAREITPIGEGAAGAAGQTALTGSIIVPGAPLVTAGSTIGIFDAPWENVNGGCLVRWVRHRYSKQQGYISVIDFCKPGGGL